MHWPCVSCNCNVTPSEALVNVLSLWIEYTYVMYTCIIVYNVFISIFSHSPPAVSHQHTHTHINYRIIRRWKCFAHWIPAIHSISSKLLTICGIIIPSAQSTKSCCIHGKFKSKTNTYPFNGYWSAIVAYRWVVFAYYTHKYISISVCINAQIQTHWLSALIDIEPYQNDQHYTFSALYIRYIYIYSVRP